MRKGYVSPSLMCVDLMNVQSDIEKLEKVGVDYFHVDMMDNHFVPNITLSTDFIKALKKICTRSSQRSYRERAASIRHRRNSLRDFAHSVTKMILSVSTMNQHFIRRKYWHPSERWGLKPESRLIRRHRYVYWKIFFRMWTWFCV